MRDEYVKRRSEIHFRRSRSLNSSQKRSLVKDPFLFERLATAVPAQPQPHATAPLHTTAKATAQAHPTTPQVHSTTIHPTTLVVAPSSTSGTSSTNGSSTGARVSGAALGIAFGLIALALMVIAVVWTIRKRKSERVVSDDRWKKNPFVITDNLDYEKGIDAFVHKSKKSEGYYRLDDSTSLSLQKNEMSSVQTDTASILGEGEAIAIPGKTVNNPQFASLPKFLSPNSPGTHRELVTVLRSFLPTLPDELQIQQGERIEVVQSFDDGWALCLNQQGERGVVPLECLSSGANKEMLHEEDQQFRLSKRASSLYSSNPPGTY